MNEYDTNRILDITKQINYYPTKNRSEADCLIINTCHIKKKQQIKYFTTLEELKKIFTKKGNLF